MIEEQENPWVRRFLLEARIPTTECGPWERRTKQGLSNSVYGNIAAV
jgi:hypothetical protein